MNETEKTGNDFLHYISFPVLIDQQTKKNIIKSGIANAKDVNFIKEEVVLSLVFFFLHHYFHN